MTGDYAPLQPCERKVPSLLIVENAGGVGAVGSYLHESHCFFNSDMSYVRSRHRVATQFHEKARHIYDLYRT